MQVSKVILKPEKGCLIANKEYSKTGISLSEAADATDLLNY